MRVLLRFGLVFALGAGLAACYLPGPHHGGGEHSHHQQGWHDHHTDRRHEHGDDHRDDRRDDHGGYGHDNYSHGPL
ncbi:hypothetical protein HBF24_03455 [Oleiagrimonas sp. C23AA]|nr:hypothetical protein [Oleiagrimonas sp. C23AA]